MPVRATTTVRDRQGRGRQFGAFLVVALTLAACASPPTSTLPSSGPSGGAETPLGTITPTFTASPVSPAPATGRLPTGRVVFDRLVRDAEGGFLGAFILDATGTETALALPFNNVEFADAIWSSDGRNLIVNSFANGAGAVGIYEVGAKQYKQLRPKGMADQLECTDWAPDGKALICTRGGPPQNDGIWALDIASASATRLTTSPYHYVKGTDGECGGGEGRAVYAGDGKHFAFEQQKCGTGAAPDADEQGDIVVADADGSHEKVIVPLGQVRTHPGGKISWSPVSDEIAFASQDGVLSVVRADGSGRRTLTLPMAGFVYGPAWSPDGKWIVATIIDPIEQRHRLYAISADGSQAFPLTDSSDAEAYADWGP